MNKLVLLFVVVLTGSCNAPVQNREPGRDNPFSDPLVEANRYMLERNRDRIIAFIERAGWNMKETPTGLWYAILERGEGRKPLEGYRVVYTYSIRLLDGTFCYAADTSSPKSIVLGKGNIESGIEEGLGMMSEGDSARFIIPPYLAHGNFGDRERIPGSAILLVDVRLLEVTQ
jgi:FKBP-type peptidyl-prolyl cis-trans isomerase